MGAQPSRNLPLQASKRPYLALVWLLYLGFVVYGSLVPLDFHPRPFSDAWSAFRNLQYLHIDASGRADWIANAVLYVPLAFLTTGWLSRWSAPRFSQVVFALCLCGAVALAIEFAQLFFPPRTVSWNDLVAEALGSVAGTALAAIVSGRLWDRLRVMERDPSRFTDHLLFAYSALYVFLSLFPFDFVVALGELNAKLHSDQVGLILADRSLERWGALSFLKLILEIVAAAPLGVLLAKHRPQLRPARGAIVGFGLGAFIEAAQVLLVTGLAQGGSVIMRALGVAVGVKLCRMRIDWLALCEVLRARAYGLIVFYSVILVASNGWLRHEWGGLEHAAEKLSALRFMPLYYHYYTSEAAALVSLASVALMYAPIGALAWLFRRRPRVAAATAALVAGVVEAAKIGLEGARPDPTNILIAASAAAITAHLVALVVISTSARMRSPAELSAAEQAAESTSAETPRRPSRRRLATPDSRVHSSGSWSASERQSTTSYVSMILVLGLVFYKVATFPFAPLALGLGLATYAMLVWRYPLIIVAAIPAALPLIDLAPWSGRFFFDEFDLLVLISTAVAYARVPGVPRGALCDRTFTTAVTLIALCYAVSALRALLPWQAIDVNSFSNYYSAYNALRVGKAALWALLLFGALRRLTHRFPTRDCRLLFVTGTLIGLAGTLAAVLWERATFAEILDFSQNYRVTGPFSQMHTGGADIELLLTAAIPFVALVILRTRSWMLKGLAIAGLAVTTYAVMVTFSRAGYAASATALAIFMFAIVVQTFRTRSRYVSTAATAALLVSLVAVIAIPIYRGPFAQARISGLNDDLAVRARHAREALAMLHSGWATTAFGAGAGRYPETHYWNAQPRSATYRYYAEKGRNFIRLTHGGTLYLEQLVAVQPATHYILSLDARSNDRKARVTLPICEKWLLTARNCVWRSIELEPDEAWHRYDVRVDSGNVGTPGLPHIPITVKLAVYNPVAGTTVDVANIRLETADGRDLISNGDFSRGLDRWFFSTDDHLPWHVKNMPAAILFDQGWLGLIAFAMLTCVAVVRASRAVWAGDLVAAAFLSSVVGFLLIGLAADVIDSPRMNLLFLLLTFFACAKNGTTTRTVNSEVSPRSVAPLVKTEFRGG